MSCLCRAQGMLWIVYWTSASHYRLCKMKKKYLVGSEMFKGTLNVFFSLLFICAEGRVSQQERYCSPYSFCLGCGLLCTPRKGTALTLLFRVRALKRFQCEQCGKKNNSVCGISCSRRTLPCLSSQCSAAWFLLSGAALTSPSSLPFSKALKLQLVWNAVGLGS